MKLKIVVYFAVLLGACFEDSIQAAAVDEVDLRKIARTLPNFGCAQDHILPRLAHLLKARGADERVTELLSVDGSRGAEGACRGLSRGWALSQRLSDEPKTGGTLPKADEFAAVMSIISGTRPGESVPEKVMPALPKIWEFGRSVILFQHGIDIDEPDLPESRLGWSKIAEADVEGKVMKPTLVFPCTEEGWVSDRVDFQIGAVLSKKMLQRRLMQVIHPMHMVFLCISGEGGFHDVAIYQNKAGKVKFYDSNCVNLERSIQAGESGQLASLIMDANGWDYNKFIRFQVYSLGESDTGFPTREGFKVKREEVLEELMNYPYLDGEENLRADYKDRALFLADGVLFDMGLTDEQKETALQQCFQEERERQARE